MGYAVMGTATGKGQTRAVDAAIAAMASPLLEAGAIDGARGILINITGSSSLKLSEVNEASTIIQNAAHEDCNIIFGAVQDERLGDEVKITVIATGFKQDMPERRARMLAESTLPAADYEVPIRSHGARTGGRSTEAPARFASEERELQQEQAPRVEPQQQIAPARVEALAAAVRALDEQLEMDGDDEVAPAITADELAAASSGRPEPELLAVPASVFDDDFFRSEPEQGITTRREAEMSMPAETRVYAGTPGAVMAVHADIGDSDELDIPAFLRRTH
jgi:cell division protein FtsZ